MDDRWGPKRNEISRQARRHRIELLVLGMAMCKEGDRDAILSQLTPEDFQSPTVAICYAAILSKSPAAVELAKKVFRQWGIDLDGNHVLTALLLKIKGEEDGRGTEAEAEGQ